MAALGSSDATVAVVTAEARVKTARAAVYATRSALHGLVAPQDKAPLSQVAAPSLVATEEAALILAQGKPTTAPVLDLRSFRRVRHHTKVRARVTQATALDS